MTLKNITLFLSTAIGTFLLGTVVFYADAHTLNYDKSYVAPPSAEQQSPAYDRVPLSHLQGYFGSLERLKEEPSAFSQENLAQVIHSYLKANPSVRERFFDQIIVELLVEHFFDLIVENPGVFARVDEYSDDFGLGDEESGVFAQANEYSDDFGLGDEESGAFAQADEYSDDFGLGDEESGNFVHKAPYESYFCEIETFHFGEGPQFSGIFNLDHLSTLEK